MQGLAIGRRGAIAAGLGTVAAAGSAQAFERDGSRKILVFAGGQPVPVLDPHVRYDWSTRMIQQGMYDALAKYVSDPPQIVPWLAERWETNADQTVWTFHLVGNAKFHNGDPVDAEAVRYSFERGLRMNKGVAWMLKDVLAPEAIQAVDPRTVRFTLTRPMPSFLRISSIRHQFVMEDCSRFAPTNAVNQNQCGSTHSPSARLARINVPAIMRM